ncbi:MAG: hypothetical protein M3Y87_05220, partial [Myxococcota bacterium]|nr:hypothetical protein [Myxococcota bacterium]
AKGGAGRTRPSDAGARATSGAAGSRKAVKKATKRKMNATTRGAGSSGEQRGATLGARKSTRNAGSASRGTAKEGMRRGSTKSRTGRKITARKTSGV